MKIALQREDTAWITIYALQTMRICGEVFTDAILSN